MNSELRQILCTKRIVSVERGSWRWQDAFAVAVYAIKRTKDGRLIWVSNGNSPKYSEPQLRARGIEYAFGSLHNKPLNAADVAMLRNQAHTILRARTDRAYRLALRLIPGLADALNRT